MGQIKAGDLDRRLKLSMPQEDTDPVYGGVTNAMEPIATVWGRARPLSGREFLAAAQMVAGAQIEFTIWWRNDLDERGQIEHDGVKYEILHVAEIGRREGLRILGKKP